MESTQNGYRAVGRCYKDGGQYLHFTIRRDGYLIFNGMHYPSPVKYGWHMDSNTSRIWATWLAGHLSSLHATLNQKMNSVSSVFSIHSNTRDRMSSYLIDFLLYFVVSAVVDVCCFVFVVFVFFRVCTLWMTSWAVVVIRHYIKPGGAFWILFPSALARAAQHSLAQSLPKTSAWNMCLIAARPAFIPVQTQAKMGAPFILISI